MLKRCKGRYSSVRVESDEARQQVHLQLVERGRVLAHVHAAELWEGRFEVGQLESVGPVVLVGSAQHFENFENLVDFGVPHEEGSSLHHLSENAAGGPQVNAKTVCLLAEQNFGTTVPQCDDFVSVSLNRQAERSRQTEVCQLDVEAGGVDEQVLRLEVAVENAVLVQVDERLQNLVQKALRLLLWQRLVPLLLHVLLQVELEVLEDEVKLVLRIDDLLEPADTHDALSQPHCTLTQQCSDASNL